RFRGRASESRRVEWGLGSGRTCGAGHSLRCVRCSCPGAPGAALQQPQNTSRQNHVTVEHVGDVLANAERFFDPLVIKFREEVSDEALLGFSQSALFGPSRVSEETYFEHEWFGRSV